MNAPENIIYTPPQYQEGFTAEWNLLGSMRIDLDSNYSFFLRIIWQQIKESQKGQLLFTDSTLPLKLRFSCKIDIGEGTRHAHLKERDILSINNPAIAPNIKPIIIPCSLLINGATGFWIGKNISDGDEFLDQSLLDNLVS